MGTATIGMISSYSGLQPGTTDWLWHQTPHPFGGWEPIQINALHPQPDYLLLYNFTDFPAEPSARRSWSFRQGRSQTPLASFQQRLRGVDRERRIMLIREPPFPEKQAQRVKTYEQAQQYCGYVSGPDDFAPVPHFMPAIWYHSQPFAALNTLPPPEKRYPCSWITSGIDRTDHHRQRLAFLRLLRESELPFDLYGRDLPDWANGMGILTNKWSGMAPYHYNLAIENYADNQWYVSEKLWDSLLAWCLPIYYGGPAADRLLPPGSFLRLPSLDERGLAFIREVTATPDAWHDAKAAIAEARHIILHQLNLVKWLADLVPHLT